VATVLRCSCWTTCGRGSRVGRGDRYIVAAFTLHAAGTRYSTARKRVTSLIKRILSGA
jgi:hypothetical protein